MILGGIFYADDVDLQVALNVSATFYNFTPIIKEVSKRGEILELTGHVCDLAEVRIIKFTFYFKLIYF